MGGWVDSLSLDLFDLASCGRGQQRLAEVYSGLAGHSDEGRYVTSNRKSDR